MQRVGEEKSESNPISGSKLCTDEIQAQTHKLCVVEENNQETNGPGGKLCERIA